jgi:hypothetical protein
MAPTEWSIRTTIRPSPAAEFCHNSRTELSITEEAFDSALNPIRAKVSIGLRVLSIDDLTFSSKGGGIYLTYQQRKEKLAQSAALGSLAALGVTSFS